jgi:uridine kinase
LEQGMGFDVIIVEGLLALYKEELLGKLDLKIFLETDDDVRLSRRGRFLLFFSLLRYCFIRN